MSVPAKFKGETAIICGTGPSITPEIIEAVNGSGFKVFGANRAYQIFDCDVVHGCNTEFWHHFLKTDPALADGTFDKWTTREELRGVYPGLNYIAERWEPGLSRESDWISAHHGTGPQLVNLAYLYGCTRLLLVGWDMRYHGKKVRQESPVGCAEPAHPLIQKLTWYSRRHFLEEDELTLKHWPRTGRDGEFTGLIKEMATIKPHDYGIEIINCTPDSAMRCFKMGNLNEEITAHRSTV